jgi:thiol-disulfide isomerase/thioredoxin
MTGPTYSGETKSKTPWIIGGVVLVVVVIGLVVFLSGGSDGGGGGAATQETAGVTISGEDLPPFETSGLPTPDQDPAFGMTAPKLVGQSFDESEVVIDPEDGKPKVVVFLAHWCPHCQAEVPKIQQWIDDGNQPEGVEIIAVSTAVDDTKNNYPPSQWLDREGWTPDVMLDDDGSSALASYGQGGFPYFVMIGADGKVVQRGSGELPEAEWDAAVNALAEGEKAPTTDTTEVPAGSVAE